MKRSLDAESDDETIGDDEFFEMEEAAASEANPINFLACELLGVGESFLTEWREGVVVLQGAEKASSYFYKTIQRYARMST